MKDTTPKFIKQINKLQEQATHHGHYKIKAPFITLDKDEIVSLAHKHKFPIQNTFSCYTSKNIHCGICSNCKQRKAAFYWANIKDKTIYKN